MGLKQTGSKGSGEEKEKPGGHVKVVGLAVGIDWQDLQWS
jgi:hypothetical protein